MDKLPDKLPRANSAFSNDSNSQYIAGHSQGVIDQWFESESLYQQALTYIAELEKRLAKAVELSRDEAICLQGENCVGCSEKSKAGDMGCIEVARSCRAKLKARMEVADA